MIQKETIIIFLGVILFGFWISQAEADGDKEPSIIPVNMPCNDWQYIKYNLHNDYREVPFAQGTGAVTMPDGTNIGGKAVILVNPDTLSYTVVVRHGDTPESLACIVIAGEKFGPAIDDEYAYMRDEIKL